MDQDTLQIFGRQLAHWAETAIGQGRYPFRRVETDPLLLTAGGEFRPPLVFWINRDSCMAGGVLLLPPREAEESVEMGRHCARALGLRHFATWAAREVVFWEERGSALARGKSIPLPAASQAAAEDFHAALRSVMEEMKILSVVGAVPPEQLSPYCLANLCRTVLAAALPAIEDGYRMARSEGLLQQPAASSDLAFHKGVLTLLRLLVLVFYDRLPSTVQPEGLERAMQFALDTLPPHLRTPLSATANDVPLPTESAVRFHHLLRRLTQLQCGRDRRRAEQFITILLEHHAQCLAASTLDPAPAPSAGQTLLLNPAEPYPHGERTIEVASPPQLAMLAILRDLRGLPPAGLQASDVFALPLTAPLAAIHGTLGDPEIPSEAERRMLTAYLRSSWPTRRFSLPRRTPRWAWALIHLLGLAEKGAEVAVDTPEEWLTAGYAPPLRSLLAEEYLLRALARRPGGRLHLQLLRTHDPDAASTVTGPDGPRQIPWRKLGGEHPVLLRLALDAPEVVFRLLEDELLQLPVEAAWPDAAERAIFLYTRSPLGAYLWDLASGGSPLPTAAALRAGVLRYGVPLPAPELLAELQRLPAEETAKRTQAVFEEELSRMLGLEHLPASGAARRVRPTQAPPPEQGTGNEDLVARISSSVFIDGLPAFPEQYLYDHYRPQLSHFTFSGPLQVCDEFFGRVTLRDRLGAIIEVEGAESALALQLASHGHPCGVALPSDPQLTAAILSRYLDDLGNLRRELSRQCHLHLAEERAAEALAATIWESLPLPPWHLLPQ